MIAKTYILSDADPEQAAKAVPELAKHLGLRVTQRMLQHAGSIKGWSWANAEIGGTFAQLAKDPKLDAWDLGIDVRSLHITEAELDSLVGTVLPVIARTKLAEQALLWHATTRTLSLAALANAHDMPPALRDRIDALLRSADRAEVERGLLAAGHAPLRAFLPALEEAVKRFDDDDAIAGGAEMLIETILLGTEA